MTLDSRIRRALVVCAALFRHLPTFRRILLGSVAGAFIGFVCLIVGVVRFLRFQSRGSEIQPFTAADVDEMALYVVAFAAGGAFIGAVQPLLRTQAGIYRAAATAGAIVTIGVVLGVEGIERMSMLSWIVVPFLGAFFGVAAAFGWHRAGDRL